jgi:hypothetical protein
LLRTSIASSGCHPVCGYDDYQDDHVGGRTLDGAGVPCPLSKALRDLRLGATPLKALFEVLAGPVAQPSTPETRLGRYLAVAFDGCCSIKVPDTARNRAWLAKLKTECHDGCHVHPRERPTRA